MSKQDWTSKELLGIGIAMLAGFAGIYTIAIAEILQSFTKKGPDGMILTFFKTIIGNPWNIAGYNMMLVLTIILLVGGVVGYYGIKTVKISLNLRRNQKVESLRTSE